MATTTTSTTRSSRTTWTSSWTAPSRRTSIREYQTNPDLQSKINVYPSDALRYISFNFLMPPFDDIHVRKAFNWALDKDGMRQLRGGATTGEIAGHIMVNSLENNLLEGLRPVRHAELGR